MTSSGDCATTQVASPSWDSLGVWHPEGAQCLAEDRAVHLCESLRPISSFCLVSQLWCFALFSWPPTEFLRLLFSAGLLVLLFFTPLFTGAGRGGTLETQACSSTLRALSSGPRGQHRWMVPTFVAGLFSNLMVVRMGRESCINFYYCFYS